MSKINEIQKAIESLSEEEYHHIRNWFYQRENEQWDDEMNHDSESGRLDLLIQEVRDSDEKIRKKL